MNANTYLRPLLFLFLGWLVVAPVAEAQTSRISSRFLARGEKAVLEFVSDQADAMPNIPKIPDVVIAPRGFGPIPRPSRNRREFSFQFDVVSYAVGRHVIPPVEVSMGGVKFFSDPIEIIVFNPDDLTLRDTNVVGRPLSYAAAIMTLKDDPYEGEAMPAEIKLYVPRDFAMTIEDWSVPDFERDGMTAWRFDPSMITNELNILGRPYISMAYPSIINPTRSGPVSIGPANIRLTTRQMVIDNFGPRSSFEEINLQAPELELEARPLPPGAPAGFANAVGDFSIEASTTATVVNEGDPISVDIIVTGRGNLDSMRAPTLIDEEGWKTYEATQAQRGEERRELSGAVTFQQFIRPLELRSAVPPFRLVFFDPDAAEYRTVTTAAIPLEVIPSTGPAGLITGAPPAMGLPVERMTDILSILRPAQLVVPAGAGFPAWGVHAIGGALAFLLLLKAFWMRYAPRLRRDPVREERQKQLRELARQRRTDDIAFLKAAGSFIERWLGDHPQPEVREVLAERDAVCFRTEKSDTRIGRRRRDEILRIIRRSAGVLVAAAAIGLSAGHARADVAADAIEAYESARYDEAVQLWLGAGNYEELSPDVLFNIGNACYRLGSPGHAALYYRRALARDPGHGESRQNLRFIERKYGAITVDRPEYQYAVARIPLAGWKSFVWGGLWLAGLGLLVFPASHPGARIRVAGICGLIIGPLLISAGALGWRYFPNDAQFAPVERQAVIVAPDAVLHSDAARNAPEVIDAPPGSLCEIIQYTGRWAYVAFATRTRGWIPVESLEKVIPDTPPTLPEIRKPKADSSSA
jgi:hypothetical protein